MLRTRFPSLLIIAAVVLTGCGDGTPGAERASEGVVLGAGDSWRPYETLEDWVTYGQYVVSVTAVSERELPPFDQDMVKLGEYDVGRVVTFKVDDVFWSGSGAPELPSSLEMSALGWVVKRSPDGKETRTPGALEGTSRMEVGHSYIMPIAQDPCGPNLAYGSGVNAWQPLIIAPFDSQLFGVGEFQGSIYTEADVKDGYLAVSDDDVRNELLLQTPEDLQKTLAVAKPDPKVDQVELSKCAFGNNAEGKSQ
jgi:hypothetical protein